MLEHDVTSAESVGVIVKRGLRSLWRPNDWLVVSLDKHYDLFSKQLQREHL